MKKLETIEIVTKHKIKINIIYLTVYIKVKINYFVLTSKLKMYKRIEYFLNF